MIPSASMHLVFRFSDQPIRIFKSIDDPEGDVFCRGAVAGIRSSYYVKDVAASACTVGATLQPAACAAMFGVAADEVAGRHVALEDLWGSAARTLCNHLQETSSFERRLEIFESFLAKRLPRVSGIHPAIAHALERLSTTSAIAQIVEETGYSHRHFISLFRQSVGLSPRVYTRLIRFQQTLKYGFDKTRGRWIDVALEAVMPIKPTSTANSATLPVSRRPNISSKTGGRHYEQLESANLGFFQWLLRSGLQVLPAMFEWKDRVLDAVG